MPSVPDPRRILARCDALAALSESPAGLTRVFLSPEHAAANELTFHWMREAGMQARIDAIGNVVGRYDGERPGLPALALGSHLDTVRDAGRYDGMLGVVTAIDCVQALNESGARLPFAIEVIGFGDEEGVRFGATLIGSRAVAGTLPARTLDARDAAGNRLADALTESGFDASRLTDARRARDDFHAYVELHIEQGPVLEAEGLPVGVVTAINGFSRLRVTVRGMAGHAGTVPMGMRRDALAAAALCITAVETIGAAEPERVATVGRIDALPGALNVIPGEVRFTVDTRAPTDRSRLDALAAIRESFERIAKDRGVTIDIETLQEAPVTPCADWLMEQLDRAVAAEGVRPRRLPSGAGHDGMAMRAITDIGMLFVRCKGGISHHPSESITLADADTAARVLARFIHAFKWPGKPSS